MHDDKRYDASANKTMNAEAQHVSRYKDHWHHLHTAMK